MPLRLKPAQLALVNNLTGRDIVLKARQLGMSTVIQARLFWLQMQGNRRTSTLCHEDDLTSVLRRMTDRFYAEYPEDQRPARKYANAKVTTYSEINSESSIATVGGTAGTRKGRGSSMTDIHGTEVARWPDQKGVMAAAMQAGNPDIILESTPDGMTDWFYAECMAALDGKSVWTLHFFAWWWDPEYRIALEPGETLIYTEDEAALVAEHNLDPEQIKWRRRKILELPHTFRQEYPEDPYSCFLSSGKSFFGDVEHVFTALLDAKPQPGRRYVAGLDFGQTTDFTVLIVLDAETFQMVDILRVNRTSWSDMRGQIVRMVAKWGADLWAEENSMGANIEELAQAVALNAFQTNAKTKAPLVQGLYIALHEQGLKLQNHPKLRHELRAFVSKQTATGHWQYEGGDGAHDDCVIALALAWHGIMDGMYIPGDIHYAPEYAISGGDY